MPILLVFLLAVSLGWLQTRHCPVLRDGAVATVAPARSWQEACHARLDAARSEAAEAADFPEFARGELHTDDNPGGHGGVWYRVELPSGVRYGAGVSGVQDGDIPDADWYSLNGAIDPADRFSYWKDQSGRSGFAAGVDVAAVRRAAFQLVFRRAIDDCLDMTE